MSNIQRGKASLFMVSFSILLWCAPMTALAVDAETIAENLDNWFVPVAPDAYGAIIERLPEEEVKNISTVLKGLEIFWYLKSGLDIANKIDAGDNTGAALDAASATAKVLVSKMADETTKRVLVAGVSVAALPLTGLLTAIDIARAARAAEAASRVALDLERLDYKVHSDTTLKNKGRKLGEGDPIRQDAGAVEYLWRIVLQDKNFEAVFKTYVTTELGQDWPEPSSWDKLTVSSEFLREATLLQEQKRLKSHIKGLLSEANKVAKAREAEMLVSRQLKELAAVAEKLNGEALQKALEAYQYALVKLPEVREYLRAFPPKLESFKANYDKATAAELEEIKKLIIREQVTIRCRQ